MIKIILPDNSTSDQPTAQIVDVGRHGIDKSFLQKRASESVNFDHVRPDSKDQSLIHLIAMGASDNFGSNRNGDSFYKTARALELPEPDWSTIRLADGTTEKKSSATFSDKTHKGLIEKHSSFKTGNVYRDHKNKPHLGDKIWGQVKESAYNHDMDRVELMIQVDNNGWSNELEKLAKGEDIPFSMACTPNPDTPVLTSTGYKPISKITDGELVFTHKGRWQKVKEVVRRKYTGTTYRVFVENLPSYIELTSEHPMLSIFSAAHIAAIKADSELESAVETKMQSAIWAQAKDLSAGDRLLFSYPDNVPDVEPINSPDFAYILAKHLVESNLNANTEDALSRFIGNGEVYLGLYNSEHDVRAAFLAGLFDSYNGIITQDELCLLDSRPVFALQVRDLCQSLGISCRLAMVDAPISDGEIVPAVKVAVPVANCVDIAPFLRAAQDYEVVQELLDTAPRGDFLTDRLKAVDIQKIRTRKVDNIIVFNLEVEEDESYLMAGLVSHNCKLPYDQCSVCGHKAPNRNKYCSHLSNGLGQMLKSGHVISAVNDNPDFFDISKVNRPADRIAWSLVKAANDASIVGGAELAQDPDYVEYPDLADLVEASRIMKRAEIIRKLAEMEKRIPLQVKEVVNNTGSTTKLDRYYGKHEKMADLFKSLVRQEVCLPMDKFAKLVLGDSPKADQVAKEANLRLDSLYTDTLDSIRSVAGNSAYDPYYYAIDGHAEKVASDLSTNWSLHPEAVKSRVTNNTLTGKRPAPTRQESEPREFSKVAKALRDNYAAYQLSFVEEVTKNGNATQDYYLNALVAQNSL